MSTLQAGRATSPALDGDQTDPNEPGWSNHSGTVEPFERDPDFDVERYSAQAFGAFFSEEEHGPVRWRFAPSAAPVARDFAFHPTQQMTDLDDRSLLVEFTASGWVEMAWHLVQWGSAVEVLEPLALKEMLEQVRRREVGILP